MNTPVPNDPIQALDQCIETIRAMRVLRHADEYPPGHSECPKRPKFVQDWEQKHGPAPESAERFLRQ